MQKNNKLFLISYSFPPANSPAAKRVYYFAKYLPEFGVKTTVLTAEKQLSSLGYGSNLPLTDIDFIRIPKQPESLDTTSKQVVKNEFVSRVIKHLLFPDRGIIWLLKGFRDGYSFLKKNKDVDYIFASAPSFVNFIIAILLKRIFNKKLVLDFRDFYFTEGLFKRVFPLRLLDKLLEFIAVKNADHVLFISNGMMRAYRKAYPILSSKSSLIYNGVDVSTWHPVQNQKALNDKIVFFYAGSFYFNSTHPRNIFLMLDCLLNLFKEGLIPDFEIHIASNLTLSERELFNNEKYIKHIRLLGLLTQDEVQNYYSQVDACLLLLGNSKQDQSALPIKAFEYIHSGLAILALTPFDAEINELLRTNSQFAACHYEKSTTHNEKTILDWFVAIKNSATTISNNELILSFDRKYQAQQLATIIKNL